MSSRPSLRLALPLVAALAFAGLVPANPGVVFEIETTDHSTSPATVDVAELMIEGRNVSMSITGPRNDGRMTYKGAEARLVLVDHEDQSFIVMDEEAMAGLSGRANDAMAEMDRMIESLPPEQQAMVRRAREQGGMPGMAGMPGMPGMPTQPEVEVRKTGRSDTRQGFRAQEVEVFEDGMLARRLWIAPWSEIDGGDEARAALVEMGAFFEELLSSLPSLPGSPGPMVQNPFQHMSLEDGFPVLTQELGPDGEVESESALRSVTRRTVDPDAFEPPTGYTRRSLMPGG